MFEYLGKYRAVMVTGPQRSGTRICAHMIAEDSGLRYVDEHDVGFWEGGFFDIVSLVGLFNRETKFVVQAPGACCVAHLIGRDADVAIVLMRRPVEEIVASQERIGWRHETAELAMYGQSEGVISEIKYHYWDTRQRAGIVNPIEVEYQSLSEHPLWVPKEERGGFTGTQWRL